MLDSHWSTAKHVYILEVLSISIRHQLRKEKRRSNFILLLWFSSVRFSSTVPFIHDQVQFLLFTISRGKKRKIASWVLQVNCWHKTRAEFGLQGLDTTFKVTFNIWPMILLASSGTAVLQWTQAWEGTLAVFTDELLAIALETNAEPGWSFLSGSGPRHLKKTPEMKVCRRVYSAIHDWNTYMWNHTQ